MFLNFYKNKIIDAILILKMIDRLYEVYILLSMFWSIQLLIQVLIIIYIIEMLGDNIG